MGPLVNRYDSLFVHTHREKSFSDDGYPLSVLVIRKTLQRMAFADDFLVKAVISIRKHDLYGWKLFGSNNSGEDLT